MIQRSAPVRFAAELRPRERPAGTRRELVDPQPGESVAGRGPKDQRPGGDGRAWAPGDAALRTATRGRGGGPPPRGRDGPTRAAACARRPWAPDAPCRHPPPDG